MQNNLPGYVRVDGKSLAASWSASKKCWVVEPGDATHYEVAVRDELVLAVVGALDSDGNGIILHTGSGHVRRCNNPSEYTRDVLTFFARLAAGWPMREPECLRSRREMYERLAAEGES